jgi:flavin-binding protein dodecin
MPDRVYRVTEVIGVSDESWEAAARSAVQTAASTVRDLRVAEVVRQEVVIENGQVSGFRVRLAISFKYESGRLAANGLWGLAGLLGVAQDDAHLASELIASGVTTQPVSTVTAVVAARREGASINAAAKATGINYRTAQRIAEAAAERRQTDLVAAS